MKQDYFAWLCEIVEDKYSPVTYDILMLDLSKAEFGVLIPNDINRCMDGVNLRFEYETENRGYFADDTPCSMLEMLIALARRMNYELSGNDPDEHDYTAKYFWDMIANLGLDVYDDAHYSSADVKALIKRFVDRDYGYSGDGGLFPLHWPDRDQRDVEIWYQMNAYLQENFPY